MKCVEKQKPLRSLNRAGTCRSNVLRMLPRLVRKWATMWEDMSFWLHGNISASSWLFRPCCKQSLETRSKSSSFFVFFFLFHYWLMSATFFYFKVFWCESDTSLCFITALVHPLSVQLCSLPAAVSVLVPCWELTVSFHSLGMKPLKVKAVYRSLEEGVQVLKQDDACQTEP